SKGESLSENAIQEARLTSLAEELDRVYRCLLRNAREGSEIDAAATSCFYSSEPCVALDHLQTAFGLSSFERDLLLLCAGASLESRFASACAAVHKDPQMTWPTFGLGLLVLDEPHWSCLSRNRPLRYWRLLEMDNAPFLHAPLRIDERVLQFLMGVPSPDERLEPLVHAISFAAPDRNGEGGSGERQTARRIARLWQRPGTRSRRALLVG